MNVESTINFESMAYIMKYFKKGGDWGTVTLRNSNDEIECFLQGHYLSAIESAWRIFGFFQASLFAQAPHTHHHGGVQPLSRRRQI